MVSPPVALMVGTVVNKFLDAWLKIEKIRKVRAELAEMGLKGTALNELTEQITTTVEEVVEESTTLVLAEYPGDAGRKNELKNAIREDTRRLFGQIERGLTVEFQVSKKAEEGDGANLKLLKDIQTLANTMKFPTVPKEPMLLESGEILEGVIHTKHSKKTTTQRTSTKKGAKDAEPTENADS